VAFCFNLFIGEWAFIPLALVYWGATFFISQRELGKSGVKELF
jgi:hypothetical protein